MFFLHRCDADPEALADYVLALLKHDAAEPELRKMFVNQLEEFLEKGTVSPHLGIIAVETLDIANDLGYRGLQICRLPLLRSTNEILHAL